MRADEVAPTLLELKDMIWAWRHQYEEYFATPTPLMSIYFSETEIGEAKDAWIRANTGDQFNRKTQQKNIQLQHELTQTLFMVITALGEEWQPYLVASVIRVSYSRIAMYISWAACLAEHGSNSHSFLNYAAIKLLQEIDRPVEEMQDVLRKLYVGRVMPKMYPGALACG